MAESKHIMVVDDEEAVRDVLCRFLMNRGYKTVAVSDGQSAISYASKKKPDVILLDIRMPGLDGISTCQMLKRILRSSPDSGIIILTGYGSPNNIIRSIASGAIDIIRKPFDLEDVHKRINTWFEVRSLEDEVSRIRAYSKKMFSCNKENNLYE